MEKNGLPRELATCLISFLTDNLPGPPKRTKGRCNVSPTPDENLAATPFLDFDRSPVSAFARSATGGAISDRERAVRLFYAVRDGIRYDPYGIDLSVGGMRASTTLSAGRAWCVPKSVLLAACCRAVGIPARLGFADVRNHLSTERLRERISFTGTATRPLISTDTGARPHRPSTSSCAGNSTSNRWNSTVTKTPCFTPMTSRATNTWNISATVENFRTCRWNKL